MNKFVKKFGWIVALSVFLLTVIGVLFFNSPLEKLQATDSKETTNQLITNFFSNEATKTEQEKIINPLVDTQMRELSRHIVLGASIYGAAGPGDVVVQLKPQQGDRTYTMEWPYDYWPDPNTNTALQQLAYNSANANGFPYKVLTGNYKKVVKLLPNPIVAAYGAGWNKLPLGQTTAENNPDNMFQWPNIPPNFKDITKYTYPGYTGDGWATLTFWYSAIFEGDTNYLTAEPIAQQVPVGYPTGSTSNWTVTANDIKNWVQNVNMVNVANGNKTPIPSGYTVDFFDAMRTIDVSKPSDDQFINVKVSYGGLTALVAIPIKVGDVTPPKEPLKVVFVKYNDPNYTDDGPNYLSYRLPGAQMEFQSLKSNGTWQKFNVPNDTTNYTTNQYGEIVLSQAVIDAIKQYGGEKEDQKFRFVEKKAPDGYVQPNGSSNPGADFTSEEMVLTKDTEGQQVFRLVNKKVTTPPTTALKIEFTKYQEDGKTPLAGAKFVMQRQLESSGKWALMSPAAANGNVVFTTNAQGKIIISESENTAFWNSMRTYGGNSENKQFRFREISAPSGYEQPPGYDVSNPMQESDSDSALAPFVTKAFFVNNSTTGTIDPTLTNKKAKLIVALHKVNESGQSLPGAVLVLQSQRRTEKNNWSTVVTSGLTTADVTFTTDSNGYAYLPEKLINNMRTYGKDYEYRFREITAPSGYATPPAYSGGKEADGSPAGFVSEVFQVDGTTTTNKTITVVNYKEGQQQKPGNITVYYWRDGTEVTSSRRTINTSSYAVGEEVPIPSPSGDWSDYTFNHAVINDTTHTVNTWPVKVTLTTAEQHVWVYYDKNPPAQTYGDVTVNYYIKGTKTKIQDSILLLGNAATKPVPPPPSSLSYQGKTYTLNPMAELNGLNLPASSATEVTMTADDQELNFYYDPPVEPKPASISVYYYIENTTTPVHDMYSWVPTNAIGSQVQAPASQEYTYQGDTYELVSYKLNTTGGIATSTSNPISVTVSATQQSVYYYYRKKVAPPTPGQPVTVNYYIENTTTALQNSTTITGNVGDNKPVPTPPATLTKDGINYQLTSAELDGTEVALPFGTVLITNQQRTLNFYYKATITPGGTVTVYYYQGQGNDTDKYTYVNGSKKELKGNVGDVFDVTTSSVGDFTGYKFKVAYINLNSSETNVTSPPVKVTVTDKAQTVWVYYEKEAPTYYLKQVKVPTQTYSAGINALDQGQWQELFGNGNMIAVMQTGNANPLVYLDQTTYTFMPTLDTAQTPWNSTVGTDRTFKVTITPTPNLLGKFPGLQSIVADAKLTFIDAAYTLQLMIRNQDGEVATFAPSIDHPFVMQDISEGLGVDAWPYEGTVNATDRTIVGFPDFSFVVGTQYRVKQTATPGEDYPTLWNNGNMTKTFALTKDNELTVFQASGGGTPGNYAVANKEVKINDTWSAKYNTNAKVLTFYFVNEEVPPGELTWTVPGDMDFGEVKTPVRQAQDIFLQAQQDQKNWQISVNDTRQKNRNQWDITAQLTTPLTNTVNQKQLAKNILKFKSTANGTAQDLSQATQIYQSAINPALGDTPITWNSTSGFYLDLISNGYYPVGQYVGNVTFTLNTTP